MTGEDETQPQDTERSADDAAWDAIEKRQQDAAMRRLEALAERLLKPPPPIDPDDEEYS